NKLLNNKFRLYYHDVFNILAFRENRYAVQQNKRNVIGISSYNLKRPSDLTMLYRIPKLLKIEPPILMFLLSSPKARYMDICLSMTYSTRTESRSRSSNFIPDTLSSFVYFPLRYSMETVNLFSPYNNRNPYSWDF